jgi:hypothetical protein
MSQENGHWYTPQGEPLHFVEKKDGSGKRPTTLADARKLNLLPSVTTILKTLNKPQLTDWIVQQNVLAAVTTPRIDGEGLDDFVKRIMERDAKSETDAAKDRGTELHAALELLFQGRDAEVSPETLPWVLPAFQAISARGKTIAVEQVVVGDGYAGRLDLRQWLWDWKTTKKLPDPKKGGAWSEHRLQLSAYASALFVESNCHTSDFCTGNVYISTVEQGAFVICEHGPWTDTYLRGFKPLVTHWQWSTGYVPQQVNEATEQRQ